MSKKKYDIAIAYRIYPLVSKETAIYSDNKYLLSEFCLYSFAKSLQNINAKIFVILDACPPEYDELFNKYLNKFDFELIHKEGIGNAGTFNLQMELLLNQEFSDTIYFAEDDYYYLDNSFQLMLEFMQSGNVDFITPYDHPDYYNIGFHNYKSEIKFHNHHWRSTISTTMTFMTTKNILQKTKKVFESYLKNNSDASLWASISGNQFRNLKYIFKNIINNKTNFKYFLKSYYYNPIFTVFKKKYRLMSPIPSLAVHMEKKFLSPRIDWYRLFEKTITEINKEN
jgi:hypothetical protein